MAIYGTALLSLCLLIGLSAGRLIGHLAGLEDKDIGGVGIAMILLILACDWLHRSGRLKPPSEAGIVYWGSIYVPVVVAMAASQNVLAAVRGGPMAIMAGISGVAVCFLLTGVLVKSGRKAANGDGKEDQA